MSKEKCPACGEPLVVVEGVTTTTRPYREVPCCEACGDILDDDGPEYVKDTRAYEQARRDLGQEFDHGCDAAQQGEPQATQWYVTVFALHNGKPYATKVVVSGRSTVPGIIKVAEKQCADDHGLSDIPTLMIAGIIVGDHENMI